MKKIPPISSYLSPLYSPSPIQPILYITIFTIFQVLYIRRGVNQNKSGICSRRYFQTSSPVRPRSEVERYIPCVCMYSYPSHQEYNISIIDFLFDPDYVIQFKRIDTSGDICPVTNMSEFSKSSLEKLLAPNVVDLKMRGCRKLLLQESYYRIFPLPIFTTRSFHQDLYTSFCQSLNTSNAIILYHPRA